MIPSTFSPAWRAAVERGDVSGFTSPEDAIAFFSATSNAGCFFSLSMDQRGTVADLRSRPDLAKLFTASVLARHARERAAEGNQAASASPRFTVGRTSPDRIPTITELKPELDAIKAEIGKVAPPMPSAKDIYARRAKARGAWDEVIARRNAKFDAFLAGRPG